MREILFRGKCLDSNRWVKGSLIKRMWRGTLENPKDENEYQILYDYLLPSGNLVQYYGIIDPETVGQWTGIYDRFGTRVFEGDIVQEKSSVDYQMSIGGKASKYVVKYGVHKIPCCGCCYEYHKTVGFYLQDYENPEKEVQMGEDEIDDLIVIGNIYDNPELLKGGDAECTTK